MTYTAPELLTIIAAVGVLVAGGAASIVSIIVALRTGGKLTVVESKTDALIGKVDQVHEVSNSNLSALKLELSTANSQIGQLRELVMDLKAEREKAAIAAALAIPPPMRSTPAPLKLEGPISDAEESLKNIDDNTEAIKKNTANSKEGMIALNVKVDALEKK